MGRVRSLIGFQPISSMAPEIENIGLPPLPEELSVPAIGSSLTPSASRPALIPIGGDLKTVLGGLPQSIDPRDRNRVAPTGEDAGFRCVRRLNRTAPVDR